MCQRQHHKHDYAMTSSLGIAPSERSWAVGPPGAGHVMGKLQRLQDS